MDHSGHIPQIKLTTSTVQISSWETGSRSSRQQIPLFMDPEELLTCSQDPEIDHYLHLDKSTL
jgi:hypothetical protein